MKLIATKPFMAITTLNTGSGANVKLCLAAGEYKVINSMNEKSVVIEEKYYSGNPTIKPSSIRISKAIIRESKGNFPDSFTEYDVIEFATENESKQPFTPANGFILGERIQSTSFLQ